MRASIVVAGALLLNACALIDLSDDEFWCEAETQCPDRWQCVEHVCRAVPGPPRDISVSIEFRDVTLSWKAPWSDGGSAITRYQVLQGTSVEGPFVPVEARVEGTTARLSVHSGVTYFFRVAPVNAVGQGLASDVSIPVYAYTWQHIGPLPSTRFMSSAYAHGGRLFVVGGGFSATDGAAIISAKVKDDGSLEQWATWGSSGLGRTNNSSALFTSSSGRSFLYVVGGATARGTGDFVTDTQVAEINSDGSVGELTSHATQFTGRRDHASLVHEGNLLVLGGVTANGVSSDVLAISLKGDGNLVDSAAWRSSTPLPAARTLASVARHGNLLYLVGGSDGSGASTNGVLIGSLDGSGNVVGGWRSTTAALPQPRSASAAVVVGDSLIVLGGATLPAGHSVEGNSEDRLKSVLVGKIDPMTGDVTSWHDYPDNELPSSLAGLAVTTDGTYVYALGGFSQAIVWAARISDLLTP